MVVTGPAGASLDPTLIAVPNLLPDEHFDEILSEWLPLTYALNAINRSMGKDDLYPFVLRPPVIEKLTFVHDCVQGRQPGEITAAASRDPRCSGRRAWPRRRRRRGSPSR